MLRRLGAIAGQSTDAPPGAPTITTITPGDGTLSVAFTAPVSDGGRPITNYQFSINNGLAWTTRSPSSTASPILINGLTNGSTYQVVIRAVNIEGVGETSNMVSAKPFTTASAPQSVIVTNGGGGITAPTVSVSFAAPANDGGDTVTNYQYTTDGGNNWISLSPASTSSPISITGLVNSNVYSVGLRAVNNAGPGASSTFTSIRPLPYFEATPTATTPLVSSYSSQSSTSAVFRTVNFTANVENNFAAGSWVARLHRVSPNSVITTSATYTTTNATSGSFTLDYPTYSTHYGQDVHVVFTITDSSGQTSSYQTPNFTLPALQTTTTTSWGSRAASYNAPSYISPLNYGLTSSDRGYQMPSGATLEGSAGNAFDNNSDTVWSVSGVATTSYCEVWSRFFISEGTAANIIYAGNTGNNFNNVVSASASQAGMVIGTSTLTIRDFRSRHTFRTDNWLFMYDRVAGVWRNGTGTQRGTFPTGTNLGSHNGDPYISRRGSNTTDIPSVNGVTWNETWDMSGLNAWSRGIVFDMPYFDLNVSLVQRGSTGGGLCQIADVQILWGISYTERYSFTTTTYK